MIQRHSRLRPGVLLLTGALLAATLVHGQPAPPDPASVCESALQAAVTKDARAEGLEPSLFPLSFDSAGSQTKRRGGKATITGTAQYRPVTEAPSFKATYECVVDEKTATVESSTYAVLTAGGLPAETPPARRVRQAIVLHACQGEVESKVWDEALKKGLSNNTTDAELDLDSASFTPQGSNTEVRGKGRVRLSEDYEWQAATFTCRYNEKKKEASRASYSVDRTVAAPALSPEKSQALEACHAAVENDVLKEAIDRGYKSLHRVQVDLKPGAEFASKDSDLEVRGRGEFKLDARHPVATGMSFVCRVDPASGRVVSTKIDVAPASWTQSGEVAGERMGTLVCEASGSGQKVCPADIKGSVKILRELRGSAGCKAYDNWIWSLSGITVWGGCRAEFEFETH
jgi:hypothetical protein